MTDYESEELWQAVELCAQKGWTRERLMREVSEHWVEVKRRELEEAIQADNRKPG